MVEIIFILATWRIAEMLVNEDGPYDIFYKWQKWASNWRIINPNCFDCMSVWVGLLIAGVVHDGLMVIAHGLFYSAGSIIIDRALEKLNV